MGKKIMKTLDEIINRQDYIHINGALAKRTDELAIKIAEKMEQLEMFTVELDEKHKLRRIVYNSQGVAITGYYQLLSIQIKGERDDYVLSCNRNGNCWSTSENVKADEWSNICRAGSRIKLLFIKNCKNIINKIDEYETNKVKEVKEALKEVEGI